MAGTELANAWNACASKVTSSIAYMFRIPVGQTGQRRTEWPRWERSDRRSESKQFSLDNQKSFALTI